MSLPEASASLPNPPSLPLSSSSIFQLFLPFLLSHEAAFYYQKQQEQRVLYFLWQNDKLK